MSKLPTVPTFLLLAGLFGVCLTGHGAEDQHYQEQQDYIQEMLGSLPSPKVYWLKDADKHIITQILAHDFNKIRLRYWQKDQQSVWVLDEIGKEKPITVGIYVKQGQIANLRVLTYRESRGDEVRHEFFTQQFNQATLNSRLELDRHIDGITGATMSVRALSKLARIALYLDQQTSHQATL